MVGTQVGSYRIEQKLGEGGMGVVYRGIDTSLDRPVAIKVLNSEFARNPQVVERFKAEARAQATLNHPNIATLYSFVTDGDCAWMVMEFVEGETFGELIARRGLLPHTDAIPLFKQALLGIGFAHRAGIVHRDIKPANLMINKAGVVKVMDFGIAKLIGGRGGLTRTGMQMGTVYYMSPEQVLNKGVDIRSDIYSLGVTLYEMLTANVPFQADTDYQILSDHVSTPPPLPTKFYPYIPKGVENAVLKAMEKDPAARFQTVEEFGAALEHPEDFAWAPAPAATVVAMAAPGSLAQRQATAAVPPPQPQEPVVQKARSPIAALLGTPVGKAVAAGVAAIVLGVGGWLGLHQSKPLPVPTPQPVPAATTGGGASTADEHVIPTPAGEAATPPPAAASTTQAADKSGKTDTTPAKKTAAQEGSLALAKPPAPAVLLPRGTSITIRTIGDIDPDTNRAGETFAVTVASPVAVGGATVVDRGAAAKIRLIDSKTAGHFVGRSALAFQLVSLTINGRSYPVHTGPQTIEGSSRGKVTAKVVGGMAAAGGALGGLIGRRKKTALVGAAAGAGTGAAVQGATSGSQLRLPSESTITFTLQAAVTAGS